MLPFPHNLQSCVLMYIFLKMIHSFYHLFKGVDKPLRKLRGHSAEVINIKNK